MVGVYGKGYLCVHFLRRCICAEGLDWMGASGKPVLQVGFKTSLERFHQGSVDSHSRHCVPLKDSQNGEGEQATARTAFLLVELVGVTS